MKRKKINFKKYKKLRQIIITLFWVLAFAFAGSLYVTHVVQTKNIIAQLEKKSAQYEQNNIN